MQLIRSFPHGQAAQVGFGIRVMMVTQQGEGGVIAARLAGLGSLLEVTDEVFAGLEAVIDDPLGYGLFVLDCDCVGGIAAGRRAVAMLTGGRRRVPVILISRECTVQSFPEDRDSPTLLRAPVSAVALRVGFEHALRERLALLAR